MAITDTKITASTPPSNTTGRKGGRWVPAFETMLASKGVWYRFATCDTAASANGLKYNLDSGKLKRPQGEFEIVVRKIGVHNKWGLWGRAKE